MFQFMIKSETVQTFDKILWRDQTISRSLRTQYKAAQKKAVMHPCLERDLNPWTQCSSCPRP